MLVESKTTLAAPIPQSEQLNQSSRISPLLGPPRPDTAASSTTSAARHFDRESDNDSDAVYVDNENASNERLSRQTSPGGQNDNERLTPPPELRTTTKTTTKATTSLEDSSASLASTLDVGGPSIPTTIATTTSLPTTIATTTSTVVTTAENSSSLELMTVLLKDNNLPSAQVQSVNAENEVEDGENDSVISDYSEIGDAFKEHLTTSFSEGELKLIAKHELTSGDFRLDSTAGDSATEHRGSIQDIDSQLVEEDPNKQLEEESEESYAKRMKKINYLSLAQEFAELKKMDANALPFGLTCTSTLTGLSDGEEEGDERSTSVLEGTLSDEDDTEERNSTCDDMNSYTESAQPTPMDISQENVEADSLSCPESDSLLIPSTTSSRPPAVEDLPRDADDAVAAAASRAEAPIAKELDALSIDVVESWRIVAPAAPTSHSAPPSDAWKGAATANQGFADEKVLGDNKNDFVSPASERGAFDVYSAESLAPPSMCGMDWSSLERKLEQAAEEEARRKASGGNKANHREEIRRRLAMGDAEDDVAADYYCGERVTRKPNLATRLKSNMNLQICFMNEDSETIEIDGSTIRGVVEGLEADAFPSTGASGQKTADDAFNSTLTPSATLVAQHSQSSMEDGVDAAEKAAAAAEDAAAGGSLMKNSKSVGHFLHCLLPGSKQPQVKVTEPQEPEEDFETRQTRLRAEAQKALAQAQPMAHMQIEIEKMSRKKSPIEEIMSFHGINLADPSRKLTKIVLERDMNLAQLQVIFNDLRTQVDNYSQELVRLLEERDDLHMEQDSMLVDIDDLTRRLKEMAEKSKKPGPLKETARNAKKTPLKQFNDWLSRK